jgi:hypothetical protein
MSRSYALLFGIIVLSEGIVQDVWNLESQQS